MAKGKVVVADPVCESATCFSTYHFIVDGKCQWCGRAIQAFMVYCVLERPESESNCAAGEPIP